MLSVNSFRPNVSNYKNRTNSTPLNTTPKRDLLSFTSARGDIARKSQEISTQIMGRYPDVLGRNFRIFTEQLNTFLRKNNIKLETIVIDSSKSGLNMMIETIPGAKHLGMGKVKEFATAVFLDRRGQIIGSKQLQQTKNAAIVQALDANAKILEEKLGTKLPPELKDKLSKLTKALSVANTKWLGDIKAAKDCDAKAEALGSIFKTIMPEH